LSELYQLVFLAFAGTTAELVARAVPPKTKAGVAAGFRVFNLLMLRKMPWAGRPTAW
jgi:hypothetical protein